ncbi:RDD family protein [Streptomyces pathocidini]|uniref:RDD family protein n=2 Tax=Streptomyces pathocidini TaxID=1650571 RepID=A0ABW7UTR4_9ACTN
MPNAQEPGAGYYADPSIPGYIRYWNGATWVPGTSRPAPKDGEELPTPPPGAAPAPAATRAPATYQTPAPTPDETGPMFLDEDAAETTADPGADSAAPAGEGSRTEPASAWQADASRQYGLTGGQGRVQWGFNPEAGEPGSDTGARSAENPVDGTMRIRERPGATGGEGTVPPAREGDGTRLIRADDRRPPATDAPAEGTMAIRDPRRAAGRPATATSQPAAPAPTPVQRRPDGGIPPQPGPAAAAPQAQAPAAQPSWQQQVHQLACTEGQSADPQAAQAAGAGPVTPWRPPVNDPFLAAAQAQAASRPAALGRRFAARLIDTLLLGAVVAAAAVPLGTKAAEHIDGKIEEAKLTGETVTVWLLDGTTAGYLGIVLAVLFIGGVLYEALPTAKWGRTLGKRLLQVKVLDIESHEPPAFGAALRRWLVYGVLGSLAVGVVNALWCLLDRPWRQCWHDKAARTFVAGSGTDS